MAKAKKPTVKKSDIMMLDSTTKLSLVPVKQMPVTKEQILTIFQKTPAKHVFTRPGRGGGTFEYVTGVYVKKALNYVFGFLWDFEIVSEEEKYGQIVVQGKLTVKDGKGKSIIKMQYGRADIKMQKGKPMDYGNDKKAAATDCLKKCASELGIASDIYGKQEFKELGVDIANNGIKPQPVPQKSTPAQPVANTANYTAKLKVEVTKQSKKMLTDKERLKWINDKLGTHYTLTSINKQDVAQRVWARLLQTK